VGERSCAGSSSHVFDELVEIRGPLADARVVARNRGAGTVLPWDHIEYRATVRAVADPWVAWRNSLLDGADPGSGRSVTPLSRRRVQQDGPGNSDDRHLSGGGCIGGSGGQRSQRRTGPGEVVDAASEPFARRGLREAGARMWAVSFSHPRCKQPRIPVWVAARWPPSAAPVPARSELDGRSRFDLHGPTARGARE